jgi:Fe-S oxidoreductase
MAAAINDKIKETRIRLCLDCGKCTTFCPVAGLEADFNPRLIIQQILNSAEASQPGEIIWYCLECQTCQQYCNYNVKFPDFITALRAEAVQRGAEVHCSHGGSLQSVMLLTAASGDRQKRLDWLPADVKVDGNSDSYFFVGCAPYLDVLFQDLNVQTLKGVTGALRLLNRAGIAFNLMDNERCCGRDLLLQGDKEAFLKLAKANLAEFKKRGIKRLITYCPECQVCLQKEYQAALGKHGIEVVNVLELVAPLLKENQLKFNKLSHQLTYHDPCTLGRYSGIYDQPRALLEQLTGTAPLEMENNRENSLCCGASPWAYCGSVNRQIQAQRLSQAEAVGAEILVTACPKCQIHLKCAQKNAECKEAGVEVVDLLELADSAGPVA